VAGLMVAPEKLPWPPYLFLTVVGGGCTMPAQNSQNGPRPRLAIFAAFLFLWLLAIGARLIWLQVVQFGEFNQRAARQQQRSIEVSPARGVIYDRNGHELAMSVQVDSVFAVPSEIPDQATTAALLARVLKADPHELLERMSSSRAFCWIARKLDAETSQRIRALNLRGIYFQKEPKRFYPKKELAAQVLGYVGLDDEGLAGLERSFDQRLHGREGKMLISMDARHRWLGHIEKKPDPGENLVLTIDEKIQYIAERELGVAMLQTRAEAGTVVIQNPKTGEILALANRPTFNPNDLRGSDVKSLKNRSVSDIYEPGSTFKLVTIAAALEEKITNPEEVIDCQMGSINIAGKTIHDWHPYGLMTVTEILEHSSDVGAIKLGLRLGEDRFYRYIRGFGFGSQTGIELPGETRGITKPVSRWSKISIGAISMGQEIGVSPLQLVSLTSAIANDGIWTAPRVLAGVTPPQGLAQTIVFHPAQQHRVMSSLTSAQMRRMLEGVVLFGTGKKAILDGYTSAGKTGTAQKINPVTHTYDRVKHIASFSGFAPVNNPAITITVILDSPIGAHHGGDVAAPVFARIAQPVLEYLNVPHDVEVRNPRRALLRASLKNGETEEGSPDHLGEDLALAANQIDAASSPANAQANEARPTMAQVSQSVTNEPPAASNPSSMNPAISDNSTDQNLVARGGIVVLELGSGAIVPSFIGKPLREVVEQAQQSGIDVDVLGSGVARQQNPAAGVRLAPGARVAVRFGR
jgi:cell division protein FtsI/penicillin-binding protein 2